MGHLLNYQYLGILAAALLVYALLPTLKVWLKLENVNSLSPKRLSYLISISFLWLIYGISDSSPAIVLLATFSFAIMAMLLIIKLKRQ